MEFYNNETERRFYLIYFIVYDNINKRLPDFEKINVIYNNNNNNNNIHLGNHKIKDNQINK